MLRRRERGDIRHCVGQLLVVVICKDFGRGEASSPRGLAHAVLPHGGVANWTHRTRRRITWTAASMVAGAAAGGARHGLAVADRMKQPCARSSERTATNLIWGPAMVGVSDLERCWCREVVSVRQQPWLFCNGSTSRLRGHVSIDRMDGRIVRCGPLLSGEGAPNCCSISVRNWEKLLAGAPTIDRYGKIRFPLWDECGMWARPSFGQHATFNCEMLLLCPAAAHGAPHGKNPNGAVMSGSFGFEYRSTVSGRVHAVGSGPAGARAGWRDVPSTSLVPTDRLLACIALPLSVSCTAPYAGLFRGRF